MAGRRRSDGALRGKLRSPGRPPVARREHRRSFWAFIAAGLSSEGAAMEVGVSQPVGFRWFREAGGMPPSHLARVVEAALRAASLVCRAGGDRTAAGWGRGRARDRASPGAGGVDDLAGAAAQCGDARRRAGVPRHHRAVARRAGGASSEAGKARDEPGAPGLRRGPARRRRCRSWRGCGRRARVRGRPRQHLNLAVSGRVSVADQHVPLRAWPLVADQSDPISRVPPGPLQRSLEQPGRTFSTVS